MFKKRHREAKLATSVLVMAASLLLSSCSSDNVSKPADDTTKVLSPHNKKNDYHRIYENNARINSHKNKQNKNLANAKNYFSFIDWKNDFSRRAISLGHDPQDVYRLMSSVVYSPKVNKLDSNQAEFIKMPWQYLDGAVSDIRVNQGRKNYLTNAYLLQNIEEHFRVSSHVITAIWGVESSYGAFTGNTNIASSLSTLAYDGRRRQFAENQLLSLLTLLDTGDVSWYNLNGSWAGGMGQTQFIPRTWINQGVDGNGDGYRNPWSTADSLSSTANYLQSSGWIYGVKPIYEVKLPEYFNYNQVGKSFTIAQWRNLGLSVLDDYATGLTLGKLWLPAGKNGPALLVTKNFDVIKVYNNSNNYALAVSLLAQNIAHKGGLKGKWPKQELPLTKIQVMKLQNRLTALGYNTNGIDGIIGENTRKAFQRWQADSGQTPDGFISRNSAQILVW